MKTIIDKRRNNALAEKVFNKYGRTPIIPKKNVSAHEERRFFFKEHDAILQRTVVPHKKNGTIFKESGSFPSEKKAILLKKKSSTKRMDALFKEKVSSSERANKFLVKKEMIFEATTSLPKGITPIHKRVTLFHRRTGTVSEGKLETLDRTDAQ